MEHSTHKTCEAWANDSAFAGLIIVNNPYDNSRIWNANVVSKDDFIQILRYVEIKWNLEKV